MKEQQELMKELLHNANIPALSLSWSKNGIYYALAYGNSDTSTPSPVDKGTLFQAASLSKPVSSAIVLDLVAQGKWDLDTPLADIADYGPPELRQDPHYRMLTTRMVIGQCSGLANYGQEGDDGKKFIATPNTRFTYSGVALDFLKQIIEQKTGMEWENIAQDFFIKAGMTSSTFQRKLLDDNLHGTHRNIAKAHMADPHPNGPLTPLPSLLEDGHGVLAGGMLTTAEDYTVFLHYCLKNNYLRSTLLTGVLTTLPPTIAPQTTKIEWGLGMGVYSNKESKKTIIFHWGNNPGSISFCAMDMERGDCVVCFSNSMNGPSVFQQVAKPIVGDLEPLFKWLSQYCAFKDVTTLKADTIASTINSIHQAANSKLENKSEETTKQFKQTVQQARDAHYMASTLSSKAKEKECFDPKPLGIKPKPPWKP